MNLLSEGGHSLEVLRRIEVVKEDIPGSRDPGGVLEEGNPGSSLGGIGYMGLTY